VFSAVDVGAGQEFLLRAGMQAQAVQSSMRDVLALAQANRMQLDRAADIASGIGGAFRVDMGQAGAMQRVADVLTGASARAKVDVEMLGETMKYLGAGSGLGLTLEQAAALSGLLGNVSIQGSQAGTTLRAMMTRLAAPTDKAAWVPLTVNKASPIASGSKNSLAGRRTRRTRMKVASPAATAAIKYVWSAIQNTVRSSSTSRKDPPPSAAASATTTMPNRSNGRRPASSTPDEALTATAAMAKV